MSDRKLLKSWLKLTPPKKWKILKNIGKLRENIVFPEHYRKAAVGIVLRDSSEGDLEMLLTKRTEREGDPWSGHISFPGGKMENTDNSPLDTAIREVREEINLNLNKNAEKIGSIETVQAMSKGVLLPLVIYPFLFKITRYSNKSLRINREEVQNIFWIPISFFLAPENRSNFIHSTEKFKISLPCYYYGHYRIWGLTLGMIENLISKIKNFL